MSQAYPCAVQPVLPSINITYATMMGLYWTAILFQAAVDVGG